MPTASECAKIPGLSADAPVLVMRRAGRDQVYRADQITVTIGEAAKPDPDGMRETVRAILHHIAEDLASSADDLTWLARGLGGGDPARDAGNMLAELRKRRAEGIAGAEVLESRASSDT